MQLFHHIGHKIDEKKNEYKYMVDPKWLDEVTVPDKRFKDLDGWQKAYEGKKEEEQEPVQKSESKLSKEAKRRTQEQVFNSLGKKMKKKVSQLMLETLSMGLHAAEVLLLARGQLPLALMLDSLNGVVLSFRFQKSFKYMNHEQREKGHLLSSQFNENNKKMGYFRRIALERFVAYFNQERKIVETRIAAEMKAKGVTNENIQKLTEEAELEIVATEELLQFRQTIQDEMEQRVKDQIMTAINEKKQQALDKIHSSEIFQMRQLILQGKEIDPAKVELAENLVNSGLDKMIDLIFQMINTQLNKVFAQVEKYLQILLKILNGIQVASHTVVELNEQRKHYQKLNLEEKKDVLIDRLQDQLEQAYSLFQTQLDQYVKGFFAMVNSMIKDENEPQ